MPIYWFAAAATLFVLEMFTGTMYLLIISLALVGGGISQIVFADFAIAFAHAAFIGLVGIFLVHRHIKRKKSTNSNDLDIGQRVQIIEHVHGDTYKVFYRGSYWNARLNEGELQQNEFAIIQGKANNTLLISSISTR